jgi:long-subunit fatty acid transport protein
MRFGIGIFSPFGIGGRKWDENGLTRYSSVENLIAKIGADYKLNDTLSLRGGYAFVKTQIPGHTIDAATPEADNHNISVGAGYKMGTLVLDFFYMADFYEDRKVRNNILSGEYENFTHFAGFGIGKKF